MHIYTLYKRAQIKIRSHLPRESKPGNVPALSFQQGILIGPRLPGSDLNKCLILKGYFFSVLWKITRHVGMLPGRQRME